MFFSPACIKKSQVSFKEKYYCSTQNCKYFTLPRSLSYVSGLGNNDWFDESDKGGNSSPPYSKNESCPIFQGLKNKCQQLIGRKGTADLSDTKKSLPTEMGFGLILIQFRIYSGKMFRIFCRHLCATHPLGVLNRSEKFSGLYTLG